MKCGGRNHACVAHKKSNVRAAKVVLKRAHHKGKYVNNVLVSGRPLHQHHCRVCLSQSPVSKRLALIQNRANFDKSAVPARLMFIDDDGNWTDFPSDIAETLRRAFADRNQSVKIEVEGAFYLIDFLRMLQINLRAMHKRSIAWIDINGRCFFPKMSFGVSSDVANAGGKDIVNRALGKRPIDVGPSERDQDGDRDTTKGICSARVKDVGGKDDMNRFLGKQSMDVDQSERGHDGDRDMIKGICSARLPKIETSSDRLVSIPIQRKPNFHLKLVKLEDTHKNHILIKNLFLAGMRDIDSKANVTSIYWCSHFGHLGNARLLAFVRSADIKRVSRGDANVRYAWYGASPMAIETIVLHRFRLIEGRSSADGYGIGINLSAVGYSQLSASKSGPDDGGEFHVVLCRVIMGNMEEIELGSRQFQPSSEHFDSGVDNLGDPKNYIIWGTHMNTHILPEFVVSFRVSEHLEDLWRRRSLTRDYGVVPMCLGTTREIPRHDSSSPLQDVLPVFVHQHPSMYAQGQGNTSFPPPSTIPNMNYPALFSAMRGHLPRHSIEMLESIYNDFKDGNFVKEFFGSIIRLTAGEEVLTTVINNISGQGCSKN